MNYYWLNTFNMVEIDGPFKSIEEAKQAAIATYNDIQNGTALNIVILETGQFFDFKYFDQNRFEDNEKRYHASKNVADGYIDGGKWYDGVHPKLAAREASNG